MARQKDYKNVARKCLDVTQSGFFEEIVKTDVLVFEKTNSGSTAANAFLNKESKIIRQAKIVKTEKLKKKFVKSSCHTQIWREKINKTKLVSEKLKSTKKFFRIWLDFGVLDLNMAWNFRLSKKFKCLWQRKITVEF